MYYIHLDLYLCSRSLTPPIPTTEHQVSRALSTDFSNKPSSPRQRFPWKTRPVLDNEQSRISQQWKGRPFRVATNNAGLGVEESWAGKRHSLSSQVRLDTTSSQRASLQGFFAWFCSVFICKSLTEVLKQNPNHPIFVGSLHWKIILWLVRLFYRLGLTCIKSLTLNKSYCSNEVTVRKRTEKLWFKSLMSLWTTYQPQNKQRQVIL